MESSTERDQRIMTLLAAARQRPPEEREAFLKDACTCDDDLLHEVTETMAWEERMGGFLQKPVIAMPELNRPFAAGEVVADRFEIVREVGEGGMGVVYEAFDRKRKQRICIKSAKLGYRRLLSPELESALKVRHPNICLVNEIHTAHLGGEEIDFLTMEFLEGETLSARLASKGKLPPEEALEIARQLCAGLAEAHRSGIIHRDLKCGNVILSHTAEGDPRAVITDFGLATGTAESAEFGGTPHYMAPELFRGDKATTASDVYALGVMFYEMVTGRLPFDSGRKATAQTLTGGPALQLRNVPQGTTVIVPPPMERAVINQTGPAMLRTPVPQDQPTARFSPTAPSALVKDLSPRWDEAILPCLDPDPANRPRDAADVLARLERKPRSKKPFLAAAVVLALIGLGTAIPQVRNAVMQRLYPPNVRLAILPIAGEPDTAALGGGALQDASERIRRLRGGKTTVVVMSPSEVAGQKIRTPDQARQVLNATHALQTSLRKEGEEWVADSTIIDLRTQTHLRDFAGRYNKDTVGSLSQALAGAVAGALRLGGARDAERLNQQASVPYFTGLDYLKKDRYHLDQAITLFQEATMLDPQSPLPLAGMAEAQVQKYQTTKDAKYLADAKHSLSAAQSLDPDSIRALMAAGYLDETVGRYENALDDYRRVQELEPRNTGVLIRMGNVFDATQMTDKAVQAYRQAAELEPGYYYPFLSLGLLYYNHGNYEEAARNYQMSIDRAPGVQVTYTNLGLALNQLGKREEAERVFLNSLKLNESPYVLNSLGVIRVQQNRLAEAVVFFNQAIAIESSNSAFLINLADAQRWDGRQAEAMATYRRAMIVSVAELKQNVSKADTRAYVAYFAARLRDWGRAQDEIAQALQRAPSDATVVRLAVLTYEILAERDHALESLSGATPALLKELGQHRDLADFSQDLRFQQLAGKAGNTNGGR
jgi:serine/threonine protein kinase/tetratricopeptide (TPR) repeat protein